MASTTVIGLISGTSMDGVDAALLTIHGCGPDTEISLQGACTAPYPQDIRSRLLRVCNPDYGSVDEICSMNFIVGEYFAAAALEVARQCSKPMGRVDLIGSHGQTIYHSPSASGDSTKTVNSTLQIGEPAIIACRTGITTVADFRVADMAEGGTGAPLAPYAHQLLFKHLDRPLAVHNIGGISNLTIIPPSDDPAAIIAFDTGPGNMVADALVSQISEGEHNYDKDGYISSRGKVNETLLHSLLRHPYFNLTPPKACGREIFGEGYAGEVARLGKELGAGENDLVTTALALTAESISMGYRRHVFPHYQIKQVLLCGGGAHNPTLTAMIEERLRPVPIKRTDDCGLPSEYLEAMAFAVLANETFHGRAANLPSVTGASKQVILGKIVPGNNFKALFQT